MSQEKAKTYTAGFKGPAVKLANGTDKTAAQTARDIGINESTLPTWTGKYIRPVANVKAVRTDEHLYEELKRLKKEVAQLAEARNPLLRALGVKKAAAYLCPVGTLPGDSCEARVDKATKWPIANPSDVPIYTPWGIYGLRLQVGVSRGAYSGWPQCKPTARSQVDSQLIPFVQPIFAQGRATHGTRRTRQPLQKQDLPVGRGAVRPINAHGGFNL